MTGITPQHRNNYQASSRLDSTTETRTLNTASTFGPSSVLFSTVFDHCFRNQRDVHIYVLGHAAADCTMYLEPLTLVYVDGLYLMDALMIDLGSYHGLYLMDALLIDLGLCHGLHPMDALLIDLSSCHSLYLIDAILINLSSFNGLYLVDAILINLSSYSGLYLVD
ncbi:hypothetical protein RRG08_025890 [Elysia crispata]|uniref:Uncharacterized protein n=1 Tax=Elysia crispata TaxID=231223 RepID=A0AAE0ZPP0_9GAST|nr:hypothetical protein RRG08_025890 [Elysia crispata]